MSSPVAGVTILRWVRPPAGRLESPRHQSRTVATWAVATTIVVEWGIDEQTADDFYERAIVVRPRWRNGLMLPEYGWSKPEAAAMPDLGAAILAHVRLNFSNNRLRSPRAAMGRLVLERCSFSDVLDDRHELAFEATRRAMESYYGAETAAPYLAVLEDLMRRAGVR